MLKIFKRLTAKEIIMIIIAVLFVCLNVFLDLKIPDYMSDITSLLSTQGTKAKIFLLGILMPQVCVWSCFL